MRYCVVKNTTIVIDGSENPEDVQLLNAEYAGFSPEEVEFLSEEEYLARLVPEEQEEENVPTLEERVTALETLELERILKG